MLLEVVGSVRVAVGPDFPIGVKLNSADFQQGGFTMDESVQVARWLDEAGIDLLELSGGSYERVSMGGMDTPESTRNREAHFLDFAHGLKPAIEVPVMVTGGFRTRTAMVNALQSGDTDMIGIASPNIFEPDLANKLLSGEADGAWFTLDRMIEAYAGVEEDLTTSDPVRAGAYFWSQLFIIAREGAPRMDATFLDLVDEFVAEEEARLDSLEEFHPVPKKNR